MSKVKILVTIFAFSILCTSCDSVRSILGMPTSLDIAKSKRMAELKLQRQKDSLNTLAMIQDSIDREAKLLEVKVAAEPKYSKYVIIVGSFKYAQNVPRYIHLLKEAGYTPFELKFKNGYDIVAIDSDDNLNSAYNKMRRFKKIDEVPCDIWVYDTTKELHEK